ncbi:transcriptional regulator [Cypionkella sp. TWP1-2-1b2]|uniref:transcriptional regulator n=1 Tax=Cypionkella sp. TWP1-2-1b2 TaxID=2804675 RepID=UPI003CF0F623
MVKPTARYAYDGLDRVMHEKARLSLLTALITHPKGLSFTELKQHCGLTDGNLSRHMKVLQDAGLVAAVKGYDDNRPLTTVTITPAGQQQFLEYLSVLEQVLRDAAPLPASLTATFPDAEPDLV